ncbi:Hypothetical_protein [Hexamita inflata]|uniref:Hypothetical_protein n=1 Tax=Hexamita inflata TaxID=28002 RepID=A0AA86NZ35_9EUKA|nr:Hypothetical protein HINF_LOCUS16101 [Hexamita inflata]CAI9928458.1 Hypothetical protein HINF_LOCUS16103 [Hexamita inflata]
MLELKRQPEYYLYLVRSVMDSFGCASRSSLIHLPETRLGQIGCGRQNTPIQSVELPSRIALRIWMLVPSLWLRRCAQCTQLYDHVDLQLPVQKTELEKTKVK